MKKIAISQSNYLPWKGYFDLINYVDEFIFYDEVQYTRRDWRNRNKILLNNKEKWITIPVNSKGNYKESINKITINNTNWKKEHFNLFKQSYSGKKYFNSTLNLLDKILDSKETKLSNLNQRIIKDISAHFKYNTRFLDSNKICKNKKKDASERIIQICQARAARIYVTGPSAKNYLNQDLFAVNNITIEWFNYSNLLLKKKNKLSIVDYLMNFGK